MNNIQEVNGTKILSKYIHLHINYVQSFLRNLHLFWPTKRPKWSAMTDDWPLFPTLLRVINNEQGHKLSMIAMVY